MYIKKLQIIQKEKFKKRKESIYTTDYIKNLKEENFTKPRDQTLKQEIAKYEYSENPTALEIVLNNSLQKMKFTLEKDCKIIF